MHSLWVVMSKITPEHLREKICKINKQLQKFLQYLVLPFDYLIFF